MSISYTTNAGLQKQARADKNWEVPLNANCDAVDAFTSVGSFAATPNEYPSASLTLKVAGGRYQDVDDTAAVFAGDSIDLDANSTNYVWFDGSALAKGGSFPTSPHVPVCIAVADASKITSIVDGRIVHRMIGV